MKAKRTAISLLDRAQALEPELAEVNGGRALVALGDDPESAVEHARMALELNPSGRAEEAHEVADQMLAQSELMGNWRHAAISVSEGKITESLSWALKGRIDRHVEYAFLTVGEYDEASRTTDDTQKLFVYLAEGRFEEAIPLAQDKLRLEPEDEDLRAVTGELLYFVGRFDEALPILESELESVPEGRPISVGPHSLARTMWLALARRKAGDEVGAQAAAQIVRDDHAARRAAGRQNYFEDRTGAMIAAFDDDPDAVIAALKSSIQRGSRDLQVFDDPIFENVQSDPGFIALRQELDAILAIEHDTVLRLICFDNPVPDDWQPMPETCEGVEKQSRL